MRKKISIPKLKCRKCGYMWFPRSEDVRLCPKCKSVRWDEGRQPWDKRTEVAK